MNTENSSFWYKLDKLVADCSLQIDRPKGTSHPRYKSFIYPYDYGYLEGSLSGDGEGIDVWVKDFSNKTVTGLICTVDLERRDTEIKILLGFTPEISQEILKIHNNGFQSAILLLRPS
ncbi:MAG: inorganic pyrophosphatase [Cyanobacteria bacterium P01_A01_bin.83]